MWDNTPARLNPLPAGLPVQLSSSRAPFWLYIPSHYIPPTLSSALTHPEAPWNCHYADAAGCAEHPSQCWPSLHWMGKKILSTTIPACVETRYPGGKTSPYPRRYYAAGSSRLTRCLSKPLCYPFLVHHRQAFSTIRHDRIPICVATHR